MKFANEGKAILGTQMGDMQAVYLATAVIYRFLDAKPQKV